ncbi:MAG: DUF523 domain-containing protein [bacterium]|nr:DUF523 domain-containing protein [bacterium]
MKKETILISTCLLGILCRYDGRRTGSVLSPAALQYLKERYHLVPVCPEQLGGLPTPRKPVEIQGGDGIDVVNNRASVQSQDGEDYTEQFLVGARFVLDIARITGATKMITQKNSPSCSADNIYDGSYSRACKKGYGVCAAFLKAHNFQLIDIDAFEKEIGTYQPE